MKWTAQCGSADEDEWSSQCDHNIDALVQDPNKRRANVRAGGYGENFATGRRGAWTH